MSCERQKGTCLASVYDVSAGQYESHLIKGLLWQKNMIFPPLPGATDLKSIMFAESDITDPLGQ